MRAWLIKKLGGIPLDFNIIIAGRPVTDDELAFINDYLDGKRFMSRYHGGAKKEKVKKERKRGITGKTMVAI